VCTPEICAEDCLSLCAFSFLESLSNSRNIRSGAAFEEETASEDVVVFERNLTPALVLSKRLPLYNYDHGGSVRLGSVRPCSWEGFSDSV
jgi:hypothetical protein